MNHERRIQIVISGWYGHQNIGDEAILSSILLKLSVKIPSAKFIVLSDNPKNTSEIHNVIAVNNLFPDDYSDFALTFFRGDFLKTINVLSNADLFLIGGGGMLSDWQSWRVILRWLAPLIFVRARGGKTAVYAIGAGPLTTFIGRHLTRFFLNHFVDVITVRDEDSKKWLLKCGVKKTITVTADPAINLPEQYPAFENLYSNIKKGSKVERVGLIFTPLFHREELWPNKQPEWDRLRESYVGIVDGILDRGLAPILIPYFYPDEALLAEWIQRKIFEKRGIEIKIEVVKNPHDALKLLKTMDVVISVRLHGQIMSASLGVPVIGLIYHSKSREFLRRIGLLNYSPRNDMEIENINKLQVLEKLDLIINEYPLVQDSLIKAMNELKKQEAITYSTLETLL
ncbi:MAG: polysaccharide pyruvyl transferase family protein [Methanomassiliicoccus sp.]|nr:polysaccharide pyruvyl transferase family protein [Methanomassiliicoccus sp.]